MNECPTFDELSGTLYLLIEREFLKTNEPVYKVGKTINNYPKDSRILFSVATEDREFHNFQTA